MEMEFTSGACSNPTSSPPLTPMIAKKQTNIYLSILEVLLFPLKVSVVVV